MNFFTDNEDLKFVFETTDLTDLIRLYENDFKDQTICDYAPETIEETRENYRRVLEVTGDICERIIAPLSERIDTEPNLLVNGKVIFSEPIQECMKALRQAELLGCTISRKYGGLNLPQFVFTMIVEMIAQADASMQNIFGLQGISSIIEAFADEPLKEKYLPQFASGKITGAMALTEDEAGSDLQNVKLKAYQDDTGIWRLKGVKRFITNGGAEVSLVLARSEPGSTDGLGLSLFLCEADSSVSVRRLEEKLGIHGSPTCEVTYADTPAYLIGEQQRGLVTYVLALLNGARLATAAQSIGIAQAAFQEARAFAHVRKQYGRRIETLPPVAHMLTNMKVSIEASRALTYETALVMDTSMGTSKALLADSIDAAKKKTLRKDAKKYERLTMLLTSLAKYYCSEMSIQATHDAMQVLGGSGYMCDYPVEKYYRDARITTIYEGTSQLQILSAVRGILSGTLEKYFDEVHEVAFQKQQRTVEKKLLRARKLLTQSVESLNSKKDNQVMDLYSRNIVDMATDILIAYLLFKQSVKSSRKIRIAKLFLHSIEPRLKMNAEYIKSADKTCLKHYGLLVGPVN